MKNKIMKYSKEIQDKIKDGIYIIDTRGVLQVNYEQPYYGTYVKCNKCGEFYEPDCMLDHICSKQNSYILYDKDGNIFNG